jgi:hypothetical protein
MTTERYFDHHTQAGLEAPFGTLTAYGVFSMARSSDQEWAKSDWN